MEKQKEFIEIDLALVFKALWKKLWILILVTVIGAAIAFGVTTQFMTPQYDATALFSVKIGAKNVDINSANLSTAQNLVDTYTVVIGTRMFLEDVIKDTDSDKTYDELKGMVNASAINETEVISVTVTSPDPKEAETLANSIAKLLPAKISKIITGASVSLIEYAIVPEKPSSPNAPKNTALGGLICLMIACLVICIQVILDNKIHGESYLIEEYEIPVLGNIPEMGEKGSGKKKDYDKNGKNNFFGKDLSFTASESYKLLRTNINFCIPDEGKCRVIGINSCLKGEGKSTIAINLGYMIAETGKKVLLVEGDMRLPSICNTLDIQRKNGLSNILAGLVNFKDGILPSGLSENLKIIGAGDIPPNPSELLGSKKLDELVEEMKKDFDFIIFDLPPVNEVSDSLVISKLIDGMILIVRKDYCFREALSNAMYRIKLSGVNLIGFVMNRTDAGSKKYGGRYKKHGKYGYGYGYGYEESQKAANK